MNIESALYLLSIQNTAYDIDNVVEELKDIKTEYYCISISNEFQRGTKTGATWFKGKAIEIVKGGGVSDN